MKYFVTAIAALLAATPACATRLIYIFMDASGPVATMAMVTRESPPSSSPALLVSDITEFSDLRYFQFRMLGQSYSKADVAPLDNYRHIHVNTGLGLEIDSLCGSVGCGFRSAASAIDDARSQGFFVSPDAVKEYRTGITKHYDYYGVWFDRSGAVPELPTWLSLIGGFGLVGAFGRRANRAGRWSSLRT